MSVLNGLTGIAVSVGYSEKEILHMEIMIQSFMTSKVFCQLLQ